MAPLIPHPELLDDFETLSLLDFLSLDARATFVVDLRAVLPPAASAVPSLIFANEACQSSHPQVESLLASSPSLLDAETIAWQAWVRSASNGFSFRHGTTTWTRNVLRERWQVFTAATVQAISRERTAFDIAFQAGCISRRFHRLLVDVDWSKTAYGPVAEWSAELIQTVSLALTTPYPCVIFYGSMRDMLYNELYSNTVKTLHSRTLGVSAQIVFAPLWDTFEELILEVERTGQSAARECSPVRLQWSDNKVEETYFTFSFIPIKDAEGRFLGIFNQAFETTQQVVSGHRMMNLLKIRELTSATTALDQFWQATLRSFDYPESEVPFAAIYTSEDSYSTQSVSRYSTLQDDELILEGSIGWPVGAGAPPKTVDLTNHYGLALAISKAAKTLGPVLVGTSTIFEPFYPDSEFGELSTEDSRIVVCPLQVSAVHRATWIVIGIKLLRPYDGGYKDFIDLLTRQIATGASSVALHDEERKAFELTAERALLEKDRSELRFLEFAKHSPLGVYVLGAKGEIVFANDAWYELNSLENGTQESQAWRGGVHPDDLAKVDATWLQLEHQGKDHGEVEFRMRKSPSSTLGIDDEYRYLSTTCFAEFEQDGSLKSVTGLLVDHSIQKAHEREVSERLATALEAKRTQENFMDMVSHEMRNPLNAIIQCAEEISLLLKTNENTANSQGTLALIETANTILYCGNHQKNIIDDVLTISKLDSDLLTLLPIPTIPVSIVQRVLQIFNSDIRASDIAVSMTSRPENTKAVMLDDGRVLQILINLVGNAIKFLKGRARRALDISVSVSTKRPRPDSVIYVPSGKRRKDCIQPTEVGDHQTCFVSYSVTDTGPGLTPDETHSLFGRFKQASPRTHSQYGGSGLGLFISRELAELHAGEIGLSSQPGKGSTFAFYVQGYTALGPATPVVAQSPVLPCSPRKPDPSGMPVVDGIIGRMVLIVEDNIVNQTVLSRQLRRIGFQVTVADNGEEALARLLDTPDVAIVLCDLEMPVMDGLTCVRQVVRMREQGQLPRLPMVAVTGNARLEQVQTAKDAGFDDVVCKPYSFKELVPLMRGLITGM